MFETWWRKLVDLANHGRLQGRRTRKRRATPRRAYRPAIELFEDRIVPTMLSLTSTSVVGRGTILQVAVSVDTLDDPAIGDVGLTGGDFVFFYNSAIFSLSSATTNNPDVQLGTVATNGSTAKGNGFSPTNPNGWQIAPNLVQSGFGDLGFFNPGNGVITNSASGNLVVINFHVKSTAPLGVTTIDFAGDDFGGPPGTHLSDENFNGYNLQPAAGNGGNGGPTDNVTSLSPYTYVPSNPPDPTDDVVTITGVNQPPVAVNDSYSVTARAVANGPSLVVGANAVQTLNFSGSPTGGQFTLTFDGQTTGGINYTTVATALQSNIQSALVGLSTIGTGNVAVSAASNAVVTVSFQGNLSGEVLPTMTVGSSGNLLKGGNNPSLSVATTTNGDAGVLDNDFSPLGNQIIAIQQSSPTDGTLSLNANGSFTYTPSINFVGTDSFTYVADDPTIAGSAGHSNTATVTLTVTARLSIPTNLTGSPGGTVVVPVNMDNANPAGSGGLVGVALAIDYNPNVFTVTDADINLGTLVSNTNAIQTLIVNGATSGSFTLTFNGSATSAINYSTATATLQSNIQAALNGLSTVGTGNSVVSATNANTFTVTFQGSLAATAEPTMTANASSLTPATATLTVATTTFGFAAWNGGLTPAVTIATGSVSSGTLGQIGISLANSAPNLNTAPGSLVLITFQINANAPGGPTPINLKAANTPSGIAGASGTLTVTTRLDGDSSQIALSPPPSNGTDPNVDGLVTIAAPHFSVVAPAAATVGTPVTFTVTAEDSNNNLETGYTATVSFTSSDPIAKLPTNSTLHGGTGTFTATFETVGSQTITATDVSNSNLSNSSGPIELNAVGAHFAITSASPNVALNQPYTYTVTYEDSNNNTVTAYSGLVHFTTSDPAATGIPADTTLIAGVGVFRLDFGTMGKQTLTATDTVSAAVTGSSTVTVTSGAVSQFKFAGAPTTVTAGTAFAITVTAQDSGANVATTYTGTVHFTSTDTNALAFVPADYTFTVLDQGVHVFTSAVELVTAGTQSLGVFDTKTTSVTGNATVTINAAAATSFAVVTPSSTTAGQQISVTVTAEDTFGNVATGYSGTVKLTSSDPQAGLPNAQPLSSGTGFFAVTLKTANNVQTVTAIDTLTSAINGTSKSISVQFGAATHFSVTTSVSTVTAGIPLTVTVVALDQYSNIVKNYSGTVHFASTDTHATLPPNGQLTNNGGGIFTATLVTVGNPAQTITAMDSGNSAINGTSSPITVTPSVATKFNIVAPTGAIAGQAFNFTVEALDTYNNIATGYTGTVKITSTGSATLPANNTLTNGVGTFNITLATAGPQTVTATDLSTNSITGSATTTVVTPTPNAATHFSVTTSSNAIVAGVSFLETVTALDSNNKIVAGYTGTVHFSSSDSQAGLPANYTFTGSDAGTHVFTATLNTAGSQTLSAADNANSGITGTTNIFVVGGLAVTSLTPTSSGFVVTFNKAIDPTQINLYDAQGNWGPDDVTLVAPNAPQISFRGSLLISPDDRTITFVKTSLVTSPSFNPASGVLTATAYPATFTVTLRGASNGFKDASGAPLDGAGTGNPAGSNYVATFVVNAPPVVVGIPGFARGPNSAGAINVPPASLVGGIPLNLSVGQGVTSGQFTLQYNAALLNVTGASVNTSLAGASLVLDPSSTPGNAVVDFSSPIPLTATGIVRLGTLTAFVPNSAATSYRATALLHFSGEQLNGGAIAVIGDDAVEVVAYLGDVNGDGVLSAGDAGVIAGVNASTNAATGTLGGFSAFPLVNPVILGDLNNNGNADSADVTLFSSYLSGTPHPQIPAIPVGLPISPAGPGPNAVAANLSIPTNLAATPGGTVVVPVNLSNPDPAGSGGLLGVDLAIDYNPQFFTVNNIGINLGMLVSNTNAVQTLTLNGVTGGLFTLTFNGSPTSAINYTTSTATLQSNIQAALDGLSTVGTGNSVVSATSANTFTVTFQGNLAAAAEPTMTANTSFLTPTTAALTVATTTFGFAAWNEGLYLESNIATGSASSGTLGQIGISLSNSVPNLNTAPGSLVLITFDVNSNAPGGPTSINLMGTNTPSGIAGSVGTITVTTRLDGDADQIPLSPVPTNGSDPGVDGVVDIAVPHFSIVAPASATVGKPVTFTVTAEDSNNALISGYSGTVAFSSSDPNANLPINSTLTGGIGTFTATLNTVENQTLTATDTVASNLSNASAPIEVNAVGAHFAITGIPATVADSQNLLFTVTYEDGNNNPIPSYTGIVLFLTSDGAAAVPAETQLSGGVGTFHISFRTLGNQTLTVTDSVTAAVTGSTTTSVTVGPATHFLIEGAPASSTAGTPFTITVIAQDSGGYTATSYTGTVHFTSTDTGVGAFVPPDYSFTATDQGVHVFAAGVELVSGGSQIVGVYDTTTRIIAGSATVVVSPSISIPTNLTSGRGGVVTVPVNINILSDPANGNSGLSAANFVVFYDPNVFTVSSLDVGLGTVPSAGVGWSIATNAVTPGQLIIGLQSDGTHDITTTNGGSLVTINFHVDSNAPLGPSEIDLAADTAGGPPLTTLTDQNYASYILSPAPQNNAVFNPHYSYTGSDPADGIITITGVNLPPVAANYGYSITSQAVTGDPVLTVAGPGVLANDSDPQSYPLSAVLVASPAHGTVSLNANGSFTYTPSFGFVGADSFTYVANDGFLNSATATVNLTVTARLSIPTNMTASLDGTVVVPVNIDNPDPAGSNGLAAAVLAIDYDPTVFTVSNSDVTAGSLTGNWTIVPNVNSTTGQIGIFLGSNVPLTTTSPGSLVLISFHVNPSAALGSTVINLAATNSPSGNTVTTGLSAINGDLPLRPAVTNGADANVDGLVNVINPPTLQVRGFTSTPTGFVAIFNKPIATAQLNLYNAALGGNGAADLTLVSSYGAVVHGSLLVDPTATTITFLKTGTGTVGLLAAGTYTATFRSASNAFADTSGNLLDGLGVGVPGANFTDVFTVAAPTGPILSIPDFARGPDSVDNIAVPNRGGTGIPITLTAAVAVTDVTFSLDYNPALLIITGTINAAGGSFTLTSAAGGVANFVFHSGTALTGNLTLGQIIAQVPNSAASQYKAKELLHLANIVVNSGAINAIGNDGIHVNAYLGDVNGDGQLSGLDTSLISRVSVLLDSGFAGFPLLDPQIIGDVSGNGALQGVDVTLMNRYFAGFATPQILTPPTGLSIVPTGPDPSLSLPADLVATLGGTVVVPIEISTARPSGSTGAVEAVLALRFNPQIFDVSAADVQLGSLTSGWQLTAVVNDQTGEIGIDLFGDAAIQLTAEGSLVTIEMHVDRGPWTVDRVEGAVGGGAMLSQSPLALVNQVNPMGQRVFRTEVADADGALVLEINKGQMSMSDGPLAASGTRIADDESAGETQPPAHSPVATTHYYEDLQFIAAVPLSIVHFALSIDPSPPPPANDLALQVPTGTTDPEDWLAENELATQDQPELHRILDGILQDDIDGF